MRPPDTSARLRGFSLIEVMVSLIVICVGLLGIAKLQALSLSNTTTSRLRALAAIEAASLAASMHSNRQYWGTPPGSVTVSASVSPPSIVSTDAGLQVATNLDLTNNPTNSPPSGVCIGTVGGGPACTAMPLAAFDLARWTVALAALLPNATAAVNCGAAAPASCTIQVCWTEQAGIVNQQETGAAVACNLAAQGGAQSFQVPTYTLYVEP